MFRKVKPYSFALLGFGYLLTKTPMVQQLRLAWGFHLQSAGCSKTWETTNESESHSHGIQAKQPNSMQGFHHFVEGRAMLPAAISFSAVTRHHALQQLNYCGSWTCWRCWRFSRWKKKCRSHPKRGLENIGKWLRTIQNIQNHPGILWTTAIQKRICCQSSAIPRPSNLLMSGQQTTVSMFAQPCPVK